MEKLINRVDKFGAIWCVPIRTNHAALLVIGPGEDESHVYVGIDRHSYERAYAGTDIFLSPEQATMLRDQLTYVLETTTQGEAINE